MPDNDLHGKRLHLIRLVAAGMDAPQSEEQDVIDAAERLVDRVLEMARPPDHPWRLFFVAAAITFAALAGLVTLLP